MKWNIVTDSSCDLHELRTEGLTETIHYESVPFVITVGNEEFVDDDGIDLPRMVDGMERHKFTTHTACPSPHAWLEAFSKEGNVIAVTISERLSGSYNSACTAADMLRQEQADKNVAVINSVSAGTGLNLLVANICASIEKGMSFEEVVEEARRIADRKRTIFALCSFHNLIRNGRMSPFAGFAAQTLRIWGIGIGTREGEIGVKGKARGAKKMIQAIVQDIEEFIQEHGNPVRTVYISHCQNPETAKQLKDAILDRWEDIRIEIHETKGLCSYYAERRGLIVAYL